MIRLSNEHWERLRTHFPQEHIPEGRRGRKLIPARQVLEAVLWMVARLTGHLSSDTGVQPVDKGIEFAADCERECQGDRNQYDEGHNTPRACHVLHVIALRLEAFFANLLLAP